MSNAYYSSGERDEETGEYIKPKLWDNRAILNKTQADEKQEEPKAKPTFAPLPKEFDNDYYIERRDKYDRHTSQYWDWEYFRRYAKEVLCSYKNMAGYLYTTMPPIDPGDVPNFVDITKPPEDEIDIDDLIVAESQLIRQFARSKRTIQAKINKHSALSRLQMYAAKTWVMYFALTGKVPIKDNVSVKTNYTNLDKGDIEQVLKMYRSVKLLEFYIKRYVPRAILGKYKETYREVYKTLSFDEIYDEIIKSVGGATLDDCIDIEKELSPSLVSTAESDQRIKSLLKFYNSYLQMRHMANKTNIRTYMWNNGDKGRFIYSGDDGEDTGKDFYQESKKYLKACLKLKSKLNENDMPFYKDVCKICNELQEAIQNATDAYNISHLTKYDGLN